MRRRRSTKRYGLLHEFGRGIDEPARTAVVPRASAETRFVSGRTSTAPAARYDVTKLSGPHGVWIVVTSGAACPFNQATSLACGDGGGYGARLLGAELTVIGHSAAVSPVQHSAWLSPYSGQRAEVHAA